MHCQKDCGYKTYLQQWFTFDFRQDNQIPTRQKPFPKQALVFTCLQCKSFENTVEKVEIARNE